MSVMTTSETPVSTVTEPEVFRRTRNRFNQWLQTEFDRHYHTMRDGGYPPGQYFTGLAGIT
ncbi:hypothetical protein JHE16_003238 [Salmonella enterica]|nr:hypothetical protein [Salmonella enterica]EGX7296351.1 hypothetical protein [Salmonella enterica]EIC7453028.1 hypothetical protein [Salmonella enterica]EMC1459737.1 hypothetical protein [Salmonella enterica]